MSLRDSVSFASSPRSFRRPPLGRVGEARLPLTTLSEFPEPPLGGRGVSESLLSYLLDFGFIRYLPGVAVFPLGWTIFVEETFYLFLPIIFGFIVSLRRAVAFFVGMVGVSIIWLKAGLHFGIPTANTFLYLFPLAH